MVVTIMKIRVCFLFCLAMIELLGCVSQHKSSPDEFAACKITCKQHLNACKQVCHHNCQECTTGANQSTARSYAQYKHEQRIQGGMIARDLQSYRDPLQCRKPTCECWADYQVCLQSCAGVIHKRLQVTPVCS